MLEILPLLCPGDHLSSKWSYFLQEILMYLPRSQSLSSDEDDVSGLDKRTAAPSDCGESNHNPDGLPFNVSKKVVIDTGSTMAAASRMRRYLYAEKIVPVLVNIILKAPDIEKYSIYPEVIQGLGRFVFKAASLSFF